MKVPAIDLPRWAVWVRVTALLIVGQRAAAERALDERLAEMPNDAWALSSRAHIRAERGADAAAVEDSERLVSLHPERSAADWFNLAFIRERLGRLEESEAAFRKALQIDPKLDRAWYGLALVLIRMGRLDEAVDALKRNTELQPMSPYGWYQLARVHLDRSDPEEARRVITHLKTFEPKFAAQLERETGLTG